MFSTVLFLQKSLRFSSLLNWPHFYKKNLNNLITRLQYMRIHNKKAMELIDIYLEGAKMSKVQNTQIINTYTLRHDRSYVKMTGSMEWSMGKINNTIITTRSFLRILTYVTLTRGIISTTERRGIERIPKIKRKKRKRFLKYLSSFLLDYFMITSIRYLELFEHEIQIYI